MSAKNSKNHYLYLEKAALIVIVVVAAVLISLVLFTDVFSKKAERAVDHDRDRDNVSSPSPTYLNLSETSAPSGASETGAVTDVPKKDDVKFVKTSVGNDLIKSGSLILVNNSYGFNITKEFEKTLINVYKKYGSKNYGFTSGKEMLLPEAAGALNSMLTDFKNATGLDDVILHYCYVDYETQNRYYNNQVKALGEATASVWTKHAGCTEHHTGLAFNLDVSHSGEKVGEGTYKWITDHCAEYGIIRRFPEDKKNITYEKDESNHFRYVGVAHAEYIMQNGLCLEEYISLLNDHPYSDPLLIRTDDGDYYAYYAPADASAAETGIYVPEDKEYDISGNNIGGFVICYKS
ncbi:MAG: M15 family metallopeptidase [Clostridia bacterium]|nr:M15 family metallopeptidase [Clostridia bacterium]